MPRIDYQCKACGHAFTRMIFLGDEQQEQTCPACGSRRVETLKSSSGLFQGISNRSGLAGDWN